MADVMAIFSILLTLGIAFPGMLTAWWLLFPNMVDRTSDWVDHAPRQCFWGGLALSFVLSIPITILIALPLGLAKFTGWAMLTFILGGSGLGTAGIAARMGLELARKGGGAWSPRRAFVLAAVALELAAIFPIIGWFIVIPLATITSLGATTFAFLRWTPKAHAAPVGSLSALEIMDVPAKST